MFDLRDNKEPDLQHSHTYDKRLEPPLEIKVCVPIG